MTANEIAQALAKADAVTVGEMEAIIAPMLRTMQEELAVVVCSYIEYAQRQGGRPSSFDVREIIRNWNPGVKA